MDIINQLNMQLIAVRKILIKEIKEGEYSYNYKIYEDSYKFLDIAELQTYLTTTAIQNTVFLKGIIELCIEISDYWNTELKKIPMKQFKNDFTYVSVFGSGNSTLNFIALRLTENIVQHYNTPTGQRNFVDKYPFLDFDISLISRRCNLIINYITAAYPDTYPESIQANEIETPEINDINPYPHIFNNSNSFQIFKSLFEEFAINNKSRTDVKFIYEEMKKEGFIYKTINQKCFLEWINDNYQLDITKTSNHNRSQQRINAFERAKTLYLK